MLSQFFLNGLLAGLVLAVSATGFSLISSSTGIFHVAHAATYILGSYSVYVAVSVFGLPFAFGIGVAIGIAAFGGLVIEVVVYAPLLARGASRAVAMISSIGILLIGEALLVLAFGPEPKVVRPAAETPVRLGDLVFTRLQLSQAALAAVVVTLTAVLLAWSRWGKRIRALRDDPVLLELLGYDQKTVRRVVAVVGGGLAGLAGALAALESTAETAAGLPALLLAAVATSVGGVGSFAGPLFGGVLVGGFQGLASWAISARWNDAVVYALLLGFLVFRPDGIVSRRRRVEEAAK